MLLSRLTSWLKDICIVLVIIAIAGMSLAGVVLPTTLPVASVGPLQLAAFSTGLALYHFGAQPVFYSFSPLNDYLIDGGNNRIAFLSADDFNAKHFSTNLDLPLWQRSPQAMSAYFDQASPSYLFHDGYQASYVTELHGSSVIVHRTVTLPADQHPKALGTTLKFGDHDFVFDTAGTLYSDQHADEIQNFIRSYHFSLKPFQRSRLPFDERLQITSGAVVIHNPSQAGFLVVTAENGQLLGVDLLNQLVEVIDPENNPDQQTYTTAIHVHVYRTMEELKATL